MKVEDLRGMHHIHSAAELDKILGIRYDARNSFWICADQERYPLLNVSVNGDAAYVHYIPSEFVAGFASFDNGARSSPVSDVRFSISDFSADDIVVSGDKVVSFAAARAACREFFESQRLPTSLRWLEL